MAGRYATMDVTPLAMAPVVVDSERRRLAREEARAAAALERQMRRDWSGAAGVADLPGEISGIGATQAPGIADPWPERDTD